MCKNKKKKKQIPAQLLDYHGRNVGTPVFCFGKEKTLVLYKTKPRKTVIFLSTTP